MFIDYNARLDIRPTCNLHSQLFSLNIAKQMKRIVFQGTFVEEKHFYFLPKFMQTQLTYF